MAKHGSNGKEHVTETPDVSYIKNLDVTHEHSDISIGGVVKFIVALVVLGIAVHLLMWGMFRALDAEEVHIEQARPAGPMALTAEERLPSGPRLQAARGYTVEGQNLELREPDAELKIVQEKWRKALEFGPVDEHGQHFGMPIEEAKKKILEGQGLPVRQQPGENR
ncbi:MAG: hypothetical protein QOE77_1342 [Blastocatellia bacterium]|jgi:hypothetical protein|nr:hypothetical protein [Blastocatellia bacterium]